MPFLDEAIALLEEADIGRSFEDLFGGVDVHLPEGTATITTVRETGAYAGIRTQDVRAMAYEEPTAQVVVRARTDRLAYDKARAAYDALFTTNRTVLGTWYLEVMPMQPPFPMGKDTAGRTRYAFNFRALKRPS